MKARSLSQVNKAIQKQIGNVTLFKGEGYFYVWSEDQELGLKLAELESTSIYVRYLNQQSLEEWLEDVKRISSKIL